jgi:hypothetical protein
MRLTDKITDHFSAMEIFGRCGIPDDPDLVANGVRLCETVLEPMRTDWARYLAENNLDGSPAIKIIVGRRSPSHNAEVGGAPSSRHITAEAADIACDVRWQELREGRGSDRDSARMATFATWLERWVRNHPEVGGFGIYTETRTGQLYWCHVDIRPRPNGHLTIWAGHHVGSER